MTAGTDGASGSALIGLLVIVAMEIVHRLLPPGTHFRFMDRYLAHDDHEDEWQREDDVRAESRHNQDAERDFHRRHIDDKEDE